MFSRHEEGVIFVGGLFGTGVSLLILGLPDIVLAVDDRQLEPGDVAIGGQDILSAEGFVVGTVGVGGDAIALLAADEQGVFVGEDCDVVSSAPSRAGVGGHILVGEGDGFGVGPVAHLYRDTDGGSIGITRADEACGLDVTVADQKEDMSGIGASRAIVVETVDVPPWIASVGFDGGQTIIELLGVVAEAHAG